MSPTRGQGQAAATSTIVLRPASGDLHLKIRHRGRANEVVVDGTHDSGEGVPTRDVARRHRMWPRGAGWSSRPGVLEVGTEWDGFAESENACSRFGYICPSGEQTDVAVTAAWGQCAKIIAFNGDLFFIFVNRIAYMVNGKGALVDLYGLSGDTFHDAEIWDDALRVANQCTHLGVGAGNNHSFVTISVGAPYTVTHPDEVTYAFVPPPATIMATVFWEYEGVADYRLVAKWADFEHIHWMITPNGDPYDPDNWGPLVAIGASTENILELAASHDTVWVLKNDGCYAVKDSTASAGGVNLTPYWGHEIVPGAINGFHWLGKLVVYRGNRLETIDVNSWQVQDKPTPVSIEFGRPNNSALNALYYTALGSDKEWLLAGMYTVEGDAYLLYGVQRPRESGTAGVTEYDWFPEIGPIPVAQINYVYVFTPDEGASAFGRPTLWIGYQQGPHPPVTKMMKVDLFHGGSPLVDPDHRYNTSSSVTFTDEHFAARAATKGALRGELSVRNCGSGRKVDFYAVAGATSDFPATPNASVTTDVETSTFALTSVRGSVIRSKAALTSTATVPVVIDEVGLKANLGFPLRRRGTWTVEVSDATEGDLPTFSTPSATEAALVALCASVESFEVTDDEGKTMTVVLDNVLPWRKEDVATNDLGTREKVRLLEVGWQSVDP